MADTCGDMANAEILTEQVNELEAKLEATRAQLRDVATMGAVITSIQEIDAVLSVVMDMSIRLVNGEVGLIMLTEGEELHLKIAWGLDEAFARRLSYRDDLDLPTYVFRSREPVMLNELCMTDDTGLQIDSIVCLPIQTSKACLGVMMIVNKAGGGNFDDSDRDLLEMLINFAAVAIDNSNLIRARLAQQEQERELAIAGQIQETILPLSFDYVPGVEIGAAYVPMGEVGGDFYDVISLDDNEFILILGDVSSHGVPAALVMSATAGIIKTLLKEKPGLPVGELAAQTNTLLADEIIKDRDMFVTLFLCRFRMDVGELTFCNAGHLPGLLWDNSNGQIVALAEGGPIVGQFADIPFNQGRHSIASGDRLFLFTDGLTEASDAEGNLFGRERVEQVYSTEMGLSPKEFCVRVKEWIDRYTEGAPEETRDDFTILQLRVK